MRFKTILHRSVATTVAAALIAGVPGIAAAQAGKPRTSARVASLPVGTQRPTREVLLSVGQGELVTLPTNVANVWTSNPTVADVFVSNPRQIHLFGKEFGEATVFATSASGAVVYSTNIRVSQNITSIDKMMKLAMPEADIRVVTVGQLAVLTGTVASPDDSQEAQRLATMLLNPGVDLSKDGVQLKIAVVNRLKTATPLQVNLQVRIAEVSRSFLKNVGVNLQTRDTTSGFQFGVSSGRGIGSIGPANVSNFPILDASSRFGLPANSIRLPFNPQTGDFVYPGTGTQYQFDNSFNPQRTALNFAGKLLGLDILSAIDLGETIGQVTTLANPNLTAISGETATFLAGGEIPIPLTSGLGGVNVEYKQYGVSLAYTPTVLSDGRISLRVRPEVSELTDAGSVLVGTTRIPGLSTRRAETTVELGSGQSFMIGGLLSNTNNNVISKAPGIADVPILGSLFRSNRYQRNETELVIVVTPYLVKPVNANEIVLPTDGYKSPTDIERILIGKLASGTSGQDRPKPQMATPSAPPPSIGAVVPSPIGPAQLPANNSTAVGAMPQAPQPRKDKDTKGSGAAMPGFSFK